MLNANLMRSTSTQADRADHLDTSKLEAWLEHTLARPCGPVQLRRFEGGQSNPTYRLQLGDRHLVLRRKPDGPLLKGAHAIEREFCVTQALFARGFPVAEPIAFCEDTAVLGTPFYVMAHVEGRNFWNAALDEIPDGDMGQAKLAEHPCGHAALCSCRLYKVYMLPCA